MEQYVYYNPQINVGFYETEKGIFKFKGNPSNQVQMIAKPTKINLGQLISLLQKNISEFGFQKAKVL